MVLLPAATPANCSSSVISRGSDPSLRNSTNASQVSAPAVVPPPDVARRTLNFRKPTFSPFDGIEITRKLGGTASSVSCFAMRPAPTNTISPAFCDCSRCACWANSSACSRFSADVLGRERRMASATAFLLESNCVTGVARASARTSITRSSSGNELTYTSAAFLA